LIISSFLTSKNFKKKNFFPQEELLKNDFINEKFRFKVLFVLLTFTRTRFLAQRLHFAQKKLIGIRVVIPLAAYNVANND